MKIVNLLPAEEEGDRDKYPNTNTNTNVVGAHFGNIVSLPATELANIDTVGCPYPHLTLKEIFFCLARCIQHSQSAIFNHFKIEISYVIKEESSERGNFAVLQTIEQ